MQKRAFTLSVIFILIGSMYALAAPGLSFTINSIKTNSDIVAGLPLPTGLDLGFEFPLGDSGTSLTLRTAAGYESRMILRNASSAPIAEPASIDSYNRFFWTDALAELGLRQYMLRDDHASAWLFALLRGRYEHTASTYTTALFADAQGTMSATGLAGLAFDSTYWREPNRKVGSSVELSLEYGPGFANFAAAPTDFARANLTAQTYIPLSYQTGTLINPSSIAPYLVLYGVGDYAMGTHIPQEVLTTFGGLVGTKGIGDMVRGTQPWGYEAQGKAYASAELRVAGPSFFPSFLVYPVGYLFADAAGYTGLYGAPFGSSFSDTSGVVTSAGAGAAVSVFNFLWLGVYAGWRWPIVDPLASTYFSSPSGFFWNFTFVAHY